MDPFEDVFPIEKRDILFAMLVYQRVHIPRKGKAAKIIDWKKVPATGGDMWQFLGGVFQRGGLPF